MMALSVKFIKRVFVSRGFNFLSEESSKCLLCALCGILRIADGPRETKLEEQARPETSSKFCRSVNPRDCANICRGDWIPSCSVLIIHVPILIIDNNLSMGSKVSTLYLIQ